MAFQRVDPVAGTTRIIVANLSTGQTADVFHAFEIGTLKPATPFVEADGSSVLVGAPFSFKPQWTATSLANFPGGPFPHTQTQLIINEPNDNQTLDPRHVPRHPAIRELARRCDRARHSPRAHDPLAS